MRLNETDGNGRQGKGELWFVPGKGECASRRVLENMAGCASGSAGRCQRAARRRDMDDSILLRVAVPAKVGKNGKYEGFGRVGAPMEGTHRARPDRHHRATTLQARELSAIKQRANDTPPQAAATTPVRRRNGSPRRRRVRMGRCSVIDDTNGRSPPDYHNRPARRR